MDRVVELANHFEIPASICINKFDLNPDMTVAIEQYGTDRALPIMGKIPFDPSFTMVVVKSRPSSSMMATAVQLMRSRKYGRG